MRGFLVYTFLKYSSNSLVYVIFIWCSVPLLAEQSGTKAEHTTSKCIVIISRFYFLASPKYLVMKKPYLSLFLFICWFAGVCQPKIDSVLYKRLSAMFNEDQKWRIEFNKLYKHEKSDYDQETVDRNWHSTDSTNQAEAKRIIVKYGYPGYSLVGESGSNIFWAIVQHCDNDVAFQQKVLLLMNKEIKRHNASGENYAYLKDRVLINLRQKQLYGTQGILDPHTHKWEPLPISDPANVEIRRKQMGLISLKDYKKEINKQ
ncbi:MAG: hypothetical protein JWP67_2957 [Mucilaginibacter sp.]|nr:hypothetical protein [Mucilaginibacter sp.]